jgi:hypothetical protein
VVQRFIDIFPALCKFWKNLKKPPDTKSFDVVKKALADPLLIAKLSFFSSIAAPMETFLKKYQTDFPMIPFLGKDVGDLLRNVLRRFVKSDIVTEATTAFKLLKVDVCDVNKHKAQKSIDIGFIAEQELKKCIDSKRVSARDVLQFRNECKNALICVVEKLQEKSPIVYSLVRNLDCLDPHVLVNCTDTAVRKLKVVLQKLVEADRTQINGCDDILSQFSEFAHEQSTKSEFRQFSIDSGDRVDSLYYHALHRVHTLLAI